MAIVCHHHHHHYLLVILLLLCSSLAAGSGPLTLSSRLIHRFSDEARLLGASRGGEDGAGAQWPSRGSMEYYGALLWGDVLRHGALSERYQMLYPSEGSEAVAFNNDFGWLHYTLIDIGMPTVSFLVALDVGTYLTWVPCDCIQCSPLSSQYNNLDKDLNMYTPAKSGTSKHLSCGHELCHSGRSCKSPKQPCPYSIKYFSENTSSSGLLVEDILYLVSSKSPAFVQATVVIGCGRKQSGGLLNGIAPDGLLGLGPGDISIPTFLAQQGLIHNSFSICFTDDGSGSIFFGDQGAPTQQSTPFLPRDGKYLNYFIQVDGFCIGTKCLNGTGMKALVDSASSFTHLPDNVYKLVTFEFNRQINSSRFIYEGSPWEYCYKTSLLQTAKIPQVTMTFAVNKSFIINNPIFKYYGKEGQVDGFCLAIQPLEDVGVIGHNLMMGYKMVFDKENWKLGWSHCDCNDLGTSRSMPLTPPLHDKPEDQLPTNEQQNSPRAVSPAEAGRAPVNPSVASQPVLCFDFFFLLLLFYAFFVIFGG